MLSTIRSIKTNSGVEELIAESSSSSYFFDSTEEKKVINEGLVFFKNSKRLNKLSLKMDRKSAKAKNPIYKQELEKVSQKMKQAANDFEVLENKYKAAKTSADKSKIKEEFKGLRNHFSDLVGMINKETTKKAIMAVGLGALTAFSVFSLYGFIATAGGVQPALASATAEAAKLLGNARTAVGERLRTAFGALKSDPTSIPTASFSASEISSIESGAGSIAGSVATREMIRKASNAAVQRNTSSFTEDFHEEGIVILENYIAVKDSKKGIVKKLFKETYKNTIFENTEDWFLAYRAITSLDK